MTRSIDPKNLLPELPRLTIEVQLLTVLNECLRTQLDSKAASQPFDESIIESCTNIIRRYSTKLDMVTSGGHIIESDN